DARGIFERRHIEFEHKQRNDDSEDTVAKRLNARQAQFATAKSIKKKTWRASRRAEQARRTDTAELTAKHMRIQSKQVINALAGSLTQSTDLNQVDRLARAVPLIHNFATGSAIDTHCKNYDVRNLATCSQKASNVRAGPTPNVSAMRYRA